MKECGMLERDRQTLRKYSAILGREMEVDEQFILSLRAANILTDSNVQTLMAAGTPQKRNLNLLLLLPKRGPDAFSSFCSALQDTDQHHLYELLTQSPEKDSKETHVEVSLHPIKYHKGSVCSRLDPDSGFVKSSPPYPIQEMIPAKRPRTQESMEFSLDADSPISTPVLPCCHDFYLSHCHQSYKMNSSPRGFALVISNVTFDPHAAPDLDPRKGGEVDDEVLRKVFTELGFLVMVHRDLPAQEMRSCIENFSRRADHRTMDSCVVCLLSHGVEGAIYGTDGQLLQLDWVFESFDNAHCPLLQNKPKMFFIQACRGDEMDCGVEQIDGPTRTCSPSCEQVDAGREGQGEAVSRQRGEMGTPRIKLPQRSDMICGFASLKGQRICTAAMRNTKRGSWFVQELNKALRLHAKDTHLSDIMVQVNGRIKEREGYAPGTAHHRCKEMSEFTSSLCKDLYLFPKYQPQY
uniref:Caspase 2, apoptosis-related cysteine peptidase n=1 Tax=Sphaeramia orbicularis TaxID=375764 RepID=A0A673AF77_9TELE